MFKYLTSLRRDHHYVCDAEDQIHLCVADEAISWRGLRLSLELVPAQNTTRGEAATSYLEDRRWTTTKGLWLLQVSRLWGGYCRVFSLNWTDRSKEKSCWDDSGPNDNGVGLTVSVYRLTSLQLWKNAYSSYNNNNIREIKLFTTTDGILGFACPSWNLVNIQQTFHLHNVSAIIHLAQQADRLVDFTLEWWVG